ncbi:putative xylanase/chitin deacetylase [Desulfitobacterium dichloroeliminans LMG P-21439]|uniref:Putative xylanase/chitin deacetylase n=1 Tax=Desulfitobacterium dichloroeliminans (strain LMG P-21439 / DCA1) TaxID=871963 RepID=L0FCC2_DESDL|nr:polysaccharide deacetylase family protein [Desulfitobacterium dichloroeliminans]AGA70583.1 putative xylanase/chitin deacetylase [Desulfitobacterium dichloroeliminans LMG P-21439]
MNNKVSIIMYHYVRSIASSRYSDIKGLDLVLFRQQIAFLKEYGNFISFEQLLEAIDGGRALPKKSVLLTFDDGYIDHYTNVFPILKENGIQGFFSMPGKILAEHKLLDVNMIHFILASTPIDKLLSFVYDRLDYYRGNEFDIPANEELYIKLAKANRFDSAEVIFVKRLLQVELEENLRHLIVKELFNKCVGMSEEAFAQELYMSEDQVRLMSKEGMLFGIHGYDHYWMNRLTQEQLQNDIQNALQVFDGIVDPNHWICCYPYGSCSETVIDYVKSQGAIAGVTTEVALADISVCDRFILPRFDTNDFPPKSENFKCSN